VERRVRQACRDAFHQRRLLQRIVPDIQRALGVPPSDEDDDESYAADEALPGGLWDPDIGTVTGGINQADVLEAAGRAAGR